MQLPHQFLTQSNTFTFISQTYKVQVLHGRQSARVVRYLVMPCRCAAVNGRLYREDPTILAWDVLNEERCTGCGGLVPPWIDAVSQTFHAADPNHLVSVQHLTMANFSGVLQTLLCGLGGWMVPSNRLITVGWILIDSISPCSPGFRSYHFTALTSASIPPAAILLALRDCSMFVSCMGMPSCSRQPHRALLHQHSWVVGLSVCDAGTTHAAVLLGLHLDLGYDSASAEPALYA